MVSLGAFILLTTRCRRWSCARGLPGRGATLERHRARRNVAPRRSPSERHPPSTADDPGQPRFRLRESVTTDKFGLPPAGALDWLERMPATGTCSTRCLLHDRQVCTARSRRCRRRIPAANRRRRNDCSGRTLRREEAILDEDRHPRATPAACRHHAQCVSASLDGLLGANPPRLLSIASATSARQSYSHSTLLRSTVPRLRDGQLRRANELADLRGRVALLTGGRVKIGYQAGLKLLRSGARLIVTTRFRRMPRRATRRGSRLRRLEQSHGDLRLDFGNLPGARRFCRDLVATGQRWTSSSTTRARRFAGRRFYAHNDGRRADGGASPAWHHVRSCSVRSNEKAAPAHAGRLPSQMSQFACLMRSWHYEPVCSPPANWTKTCSKSISAT